MAKSTVDIQRAYYAATAEHYDDMHVHEDDEHAFALRFLIGAAEHFRIHSVLDIGSGTGRVLHKMKTAIPEVTILGIEPSPELRSVGHAKGLADSELIDGDAMALPFADNSFDMVCEFGALHHISNPTKAVSEMLRVSRRAIFISDSNNFGQGSTLTRLFKQSVNAIGLWPVVNFIKTKGKGYSISEADGLGYSFSVFNHYKQIAAKCDAVHILNTNTGGPNLYRSASHVALLGIKRRQS